MGNLDVSSLVAGLLFGTYGLYVLRVSAREARLRGVALGCVLMIYPYFVGNPWLCWALGAGLSVAATYALRD